LARAIYSESELFLLDDILSALDINVGNYIMSETLLKYLKGKTILLTTHNLNYL